MAFYIDRKLMFESLDNSTSKTCSSYYCNPEEYYSMVCPLSCIYVCPTLCIFTEREPSPPPPPRVPLSQSPHTHTVSIFSILLLSVLGIAIYILCTYVIHKFNNPRTSPQLVQQVAVVVEEEEEQFSDIQTVGLQPSVISAITIRKYKRGEALIEGTECSVCLSEFQEDETLRILPKCNHAFHIPCIDTWLKSHTNCPMCRANIVIIIPAAAAFIKRNV